MPLYNICSVVATKRCASRLCLKGKKEDPRNYRPASLTLIPEKVLEQINLETISSHMKKKKTAGVLSIDSIRERRICPT